MENITPQPIRQPVVPVKNNSVLPLILGAFAVVIFGVGSAWIISTKLINRQIGSAPGVKVTSTEAGTLDPKAKYDTATGDLKDGGIGNEGTQHLEGNNGPSHYVYLTSSVVDLKSFVGKKVQVWGQTLASKQAPWLMEVVKVQVTQ